METGTREGMQTMERSLAGLLRQGTISREEAIRHANYPQELSRTA
jgi:Tfp pilus assembly pilus retraction ATPase PilT